MTRALVAVLMSAVLAGAVAAEEVAVPLRFDLAFVREALVAQIFTEPGEKATVWRDDTGCGWLLLSQPAVDVVGGRLRIVAHGEAQVGTRLGGERCLTVLAWNGFVEAFLMPGLDTAAHAVTFTVVDSNLYDADHEKGLATGRLWDLVKDHAHPRLGTLRIDVSPPFAEFRAWLPLVLPGSAERIDRLLASLQLREPRAEADAIVVTLALTVEPVAAPPAPEAPLTQEELQRWDAFLTFVTKAIARETSGEIRRAVMDVLIDGRHDVLEALAPEAPAGPDPVPGLFVRAWEELAPVLRSGARGLPAETTLRYMSFVAASDALAALVRLGPTVGIDVSADGLRR
ncbi:MAG: lytic transglycosylase domain-containing protein, partial [Gammaproteobacteria bacterium]